MEIKLRETKSAYKKIDKIKINVKKTLALIYRKVLAKSNFEFICL